jgi:predicted glycosyltransferase
MGGDELNAHLLHAGRIITRTGYTTLMDLEAIGRQALLVPTPGQPEQEYLGRLHGSLGMHVVRAQAQLRLSEALDALPLKGTMRHPGAGGQLDEALRELAASLH